jgi:ComF family protein
MTDSIDCIIPIPLSAARYRERGFNQAELIAQEIATRIGKPCQTDVLVRIKNTKAQSTLRGTRARQKNLQGSFIIRNPETIQGKRILLVDDVWTTGSTMNIAAQTLRTAEPRSIIALVIARA